MSKDFFYFLEHLTIDGENNVLIPNIVFKRIGENKKIRNVQCFQITSRRF